MFDARTGLIVENQSEREKAFPYFFVNQDKSTKVVVKSEKPESDGRIHRFELRWDKKPSPGTIIQVDVNDDPNSTVYFSVESPVQNQNVDPRIILVKRTAQAPVNLAELRTNRSVIIPAFIEKVPKVEEQVPA